jgi:hypothetical protein
MAEQLSLELTLRDVDGNFISDTGTRIALYSLGTGRVVGTTEPLDFSRGPITINFETSRSGWYRCRIVSTLYHEQLQDFSGPASSGPARIQLTLIRRADAWKAQFVPWASLALRFDSLRTLLSESRRILLVETAEELAGFVEDKYDGVDSVPAVLAKATLLNLYHELVVTYEPVEGAKPFLSFVHSIEAMGRDRILTLADPGLGGVLAAIEKKEANYPDWHIRGVNPQRFYLPAPYRARVVETRHLGLRSVGNTLDITLATLRNADFVLAAFAIVESTKPPVVAHTPFEVGQQFSGDASLAHPFEAHEWLKWASTTMSGSVPDLGYGLVPL